MCVSLSIYVYIIIFIGLAHIAICTVVKALHESSIEFYINSWIDVCVYYV